MVYDALQSLMSHRPLPVQLTGSKGQWEAEVVERLGNFCTEKIRDPSTGMDTVVYGRRAAEVMWEALAAKGEKGSKMTAKEYQDGLFSFGALPPPQN